MTELSFIGLFLSAVLIALPASAQNVYDKCHIGYSPKETQDGKYHECTFVCNLESIDEAYKEFKKHLLDCHPVFSSTYNCADEEDKEIVKNPPMKKIAEELAFFENVQTKPVIVPLPRSKKPKDRKPYTVFEMTTQPVIQRRKKRTTTYVCHHPVCGKRYKNKANLEKHLRLYCKGQQSEPH